VKPRTVDVTVDMFTFKFPSNEEGDNVAAMAWQWDNDDEK